jgi:hypothetical protein
MSLRSRAHPWWRTRHPMADVTDPVIDAYFKRQPTFVIRGTSLHYYQDMTGWDHRISVVHSERGEVAACMSLDAAYAVSRLLEP